MSYSNKKNTQNLTKKNLEEVKNMAYEKPDYIQVDEEEFHAPSISAFVVVVILCYIGGPC